MIDEFRFEFGFVGSFQLVEDYWTWDLDFYFKLKLTEGEFYVVLDNYEDDGFLKFMFIVEVYELKLGLKLLLGQFKNSLYAFI